MRKVSFAEWFLSQNIGPQRASAIMGDLEELAATRGRLWFAAVYLRTLITLGWRSPVALVAASVCTYWLGPIVWHSMRIPTQD